MNQSDPAYLRSIFDGLLSGAVHKDNASALPLGLVGMYEEALPPASSVRERKKFLEFFVVWALLKKEVSAGFVLPLLNGWTEEEVIDYIAQYSKWFNSPTGGSYVLYHERLRAFVLQKISDGQFKACNEAIINQCRFALQAKAGDEWERYALEHLGSHLLIQAMESKDATALKALAYDTIHWNRQVEISKGFEWSKRMLNDMMLWASKYDDDEVIECALNKVDLHHLEQNDAPRIVELVAQNDIETALQRIESFGGNDKEGLQRKFILCMLCLMELTLFDSKSQPWRKEAIEAILKFVDENLSVDNSALDWTYFFPDFIMFRIATELSKLGNTEIGFYKSNELIHFLPELFVREQFNYAIQLVNQEVDASRKCIALIEISKELKRKDKYFESKNFLEQALKDAINISNDDQKISALVDISVEWYKRADYEYAKSLIYDVLDYARINFEGISLDSALEKISVGLSYQGFMNSAVECLQDIRSEEAKIRVAVEIAIGYVKNDLIEDAVKLANALVASGENYILFIDMFSEMVKQGKSIEAIKLVNEMTNERFKNRCLEEIAKEYSNQGLFDEALECVLSINAEYDKEDVQIFIYLNFARFGMIKESISFIAKLEDEFSKEIALKEVFLESVKHDKLDEVIDYINSIPDSEVMMCFLGEISCILARQDRVDDAVKYVGLISNEYYNSEPINEIVKGLIRLGRIEEAIDCANTLQDEYNQSMAIIEIISELAKQDRVIQSIEVSYGISLNWAYSLAMSKISLELAFRGNERESYKVLEKSLVKYNLNNFEANKNNYLARVATELAGQERARESIGCALSISDDDAQGSATEDISIELIRRGEMELAVQCALGLDQKFWKSLVFKSISREFFSKGEMERSAWASAKAYDFACEEGGTDEESDYLLVDLCEELIKQGNFAKAVVYAEAIKSLPNYCGTLAKISTEQYCRDLHEEAEDLIAKSLEKAMNTKDISARDSALIEVVGELTQQGKKVKVYEFVDLISNKKENKERAVNKIVLANLKKGEIAEALDLVNSMQDGFWKKTSFKDILSELSKQDRIDESLEVAFGMTDSYWRDPLLILITRDLARKCNWSRAEEISKNVFETSKRHEGWMEIAKSAVVDIGWQQSFHLLQDIEDCQIRDSILKGFANSYTVSDVDRTFFIKARKFFLDDFDSLEKMLLRHALNCLFFQNYSLEQMERFNRTLNIEWAIDIKDSFSAN
jgi:hypothetical protein